MQSDSKRKHLQMMQNLWIHQSRNSLKPKQLYIIMLPNNVLFRDFRAMCRGCCWHQNASLLLVWRHGQYSVTNGIHLLEYVTTVSMSLISLEISRLCSSVARRLIKTKMGKSVMPVFIYSCICLYLRAAYCRSLHAFCKFQKKVLLYFIGCMLKKPFVKFLRIFFLYI